MLVPTNESKGTQKKYEKMLSKIRDLIRSITNNSDYYDEKYTKFKFNSDDDLALALKLRNMEIVRRSVFHKGSKHYLQVFRDKCLHKLLMLEYDGIDMSESIDVNKTSGLGDCIICHYWYFLEINFRSPPEVCDGCHDSVQKTILMMLQFFCP